MDTPPILLKAIELASRYQIRVLEEIERIPQHVCINAGGNAVIHQGTIPLGGAKVAIKIIRGELPLHHDAALMKVFREIHIWSKLQHRNVHSLLGITFKFDYSVSMVSSWMENGNAYEYVQNPLVDPRPLLSDIAEGLHYLHNHEPPVYHGDLKGKNVLISDDGRALLTDFGLSFLVDSSFSGCGHVNGGTWNWMAPEGLEDVGNDGTTPERDVWAFGMTALELFTRKYPFSDVRGPAAVITRILHGPDIERPSDESTQFRLDEGWWAICRSCWERNPSLRPKISEIANKIQPLNPFTRTSDCIKPHKHNNVDVLPALSTASQLASRYQIRVFHQIELDIQAAQFNGYALVYSGIDPFKGMRIAIKVVRCGPEEQDENIKHVLREIHLWSKLHHENVLPLLGITFAFDCTVSIVSRWMGKGNAREYVQDKSIDPRPILADIANGIEYLHNHKPPIYHGDLRGDNVLISDDGRALLTGFHFSYPVASSFSMTGSIHGGTFNWMSPEAFNDLSITPQRDVWAFGMTALELFTGAIPFVDIRRPLRAMFRILFGPLPERPSDELTCSRMTDAWWNICCSCWVREKEKRPTISDLIDAIERSFQPDAACVADCATLYDLVSLPDKLVPANISGYIRTWMVIFVRAMESTITNSQQGVPLAKAILGSQDPIHLHAFMNDCHRWLTTSLDDLKSAQRSFETILCQCKQQAEGNRMNKTWRFNAWKKARSERSDASACLNQVIGSLESTISSIESMKNWWSPITEAITVMKTTSSHIGPPDGIGLYDGDKIALGTIIRALKAYEAGVREPVEMLRAKMGDC